MAVIWVQHLASHATLRAQQQLPDRALQPTKPYHALQWTRCGMMCLCIWLISLISWYIRSVCHCRCHCQCQHRYQHTGSRSRSRSCQNPSQCLYRSLLFTRTGQKTPTSMITCTSIHCERIWCDRSIICSSLTIWGFSSIGQWPSGISSTVMPVLMSSTDLTQLLHRHQSDIQADQVLSSSRHGWTLVLGTLQASCMSHVPYRHTYVQHTFILDMTWLDLICPDLIESNRIESNQMWPDGRYQGWSDM